jgi:hypothetical protein
MRRVDASGTKSPAITIADGANGVSGYPRVARNGKELIVAWTEGSGEAAQHVKAVRAQLP